MNINFKIVLACFCMTGSFNGYAQQYLRTSVYGGISTIQYTSDEISPELLAPTSIGGGVTAEYIKFFNQYVGASIGVGVSMAQSQYKLNSTLTKSMPIYSYEDNITRDFNYNAQFDNWEETQMVHTIDVPIGAVGKYTFSNKMSAMAGLGVKVQLPIKSTYKVAEGGTRTTTGYFPNANVTVSDVPHQGFYTLESKQEGDLNVKSVSVAAYLDLGVMHKIGKQHIYYGVYGQYALTQLNEDTEKAFLSRFDAYDSPLNTTAIDKARLLSFGVKIGYVLPQKSKVEEAETITEDTESVPSEATDVKEDSSEPTSFQ